ncbi:MAG: hypothetical protein IKT34_02615 [Clostridia bacterium]|nr:hypothetical protein [Clostridia bacterium]
MNKHQKISVAIAAVAFACALFAFFRLPDKLFVELFSNRPDPETNKLTFLIGGFCITALSCLMCVISENHKKWLALCALVAALFIGCLIYNFAVL